MTTADKVHMGKIDKLIKDNWESLRENCCRAWPSQECVVKLLYYTDDI